jgi:hypothetical protein
MAKLNRITAAALGNPKTAQALYDLAANATRRDKSL